MTAPTFDSAVSLSEKGEWGKAKDLLLQIRETGQTSAELEALLGRAYAELNFLGPSVLHLNNAVLLDRFNKDYRYNLFVAQKKVSQSLGTPFSHPAEWGFELMTYVRAGELLSIASLLFIALIALKFIKRRLGLAVMIAHSSLILIVIALAVLATQSRSIAVTKNEAPLLPRPLASAEPTMTLEPGARLRIRGESGEFFDVERTHSFRGWIKKDLVEKLVP